MSIDKAVSSNWIVESFTTSGNDITLIGSGVGYSSFEQGFKDGDTVPYALFDDALNREAGYATYQGRKLVNRTIKATLVNGVYNETNPTPVNFPNGGTAACTFNAAAFDDLWAHLFDTENPHEVFAGQIDQNNPELGDNVQDALDTIHENLGDHIGNEGNPHNTTADLVALNPVFEPAGENVQVALEKIYAQFHTAKNNDDLHLNYADGDETFIQMKRDYGQSPLASGTKSGEASDAVGELTFYANEGRVYTYLNNGTYVMIGSQYFIEDSPHDGDTYARKDGEWVKVTSTIIGDLPPEDPKLGTLWYDTGTTAELFVYDGSAWISMTGAGGGSGVVADNVVTDDADAIDRNKALARQIDSVGNGVWRPIYTSDLVTENNQPMFRDDRGRFTKSDSAVIRSQQDANWYLLDRIEEIGNVIISDAAPDADVVSDGGLWFDNSEDVMQLFIWHEDSDAWIPVSPPTTLEGRVSTGEATQAQLIQAVEQGLQLQANIESAVDLLNDKVASLEGAVGEHSLLFTSTNTNPRDGEFNLKNSGYQTVSYLSDAQYITLSETDRHGNSIDLDRVVVGDVLRLSDISSQVAELKIAEITDRNIFTFEKISGELERFSDGPYDFILLSSFDPAGLATIDYVDSVVDSIPTATPPTTWRYVEDTSSPNDGEFSYRESGNQVVLVMGNRTSDGILWVHGHGREDSIAFEDSFFISVSQSDGNFNLISDVEDFEFSRKNKPNTHVYLDDAEWEIDLVEGRRYCIRIPGLLPLVKF